MDYRLPTTVVPTRYDIRLEPDLDTATFVGHETITVTVTEPVSEVVVNAAELAIQSVAIESVGGAVAGQAHQPVAPERVVLQQLHPLLEEETVAPRNRRLCHLSCAPSNHLGAALLGRRRCSRHERFQALLQRRPLQQQPSAAGQAAQADVRAQARHLPVGPAAGVGLAQPQDVAEVQLEDRARPPPGLLIPLDSG